MGHKGTMANKTARKPIRSATRKAQRSALALAAFHAESVDVSLLDRETLVDLYLRCVAGLAAWPEDPC